MRIRLIHLPASGPLERFPRGTLIHIMPVGLLALADHLDRSGHDVQVWHAGVESRLEPDFDLARALAGENADLIGFSLHWHPQLSAVESAVRALRTRQPEARIALGGMTASWFAQDILATWPEIDFVLRGEAEDALAALIRALEQGRGLDRVPNLGYRLDGQVRLNPLGTAPDRARLDALDFARLDLLRHAEAYNAQFAAVDDRFEHPPVFYLCPGRGCSRACAFCGGGREAHLAMSGRREVVFRSPAVVAGEMARVAARGIRDFCVCFDPPPESVAFYRELFSEVRRRAIDAGLVFECYHPPSQEFLEDFARTFRPERSRISFSPTVADEALRGRLLGYSYPNEALERSLARCGELGLQTTLYFGALPQETDAQLEGSIAWQAGLKARYGCRLVHSALEAEPGAPWCERPGDFDLEHARVGFEAFRERHLRLGQGLEARTEVGYAFADLDLRLVRVRSALSSPDQDLRQSLAGHGLGTSEKILMVAAGRLEDGLRLAAAWRGHPCRVHLGGPPGSRADRGLLRRLSEALGPGARLAPFDPRRVRHVRWKGEHASLERFKGSVLHLLHLVDPVAADRAFGWLAHLEARDCAPGWVLAETCRWMPARCPAHVPRLLALAEDGSVRACSACPDLGVSQPGAAAAQVAAASQALEARRGCRSCPVRDACSRCPFPGALGEASFCELRRRLGLVGLASVGRNMLESSQPAALGWDA